MQPQRASYVSKSQMGGAPPGTVPGTGVGSALGTGNRSRSKTTNRKKRNLYTSMGNYYQSQQQTNPPNIGTANSASRVTKRVHQQNFLDNLEQTNVMTGGNLAAAHQILQQEDLMAKKRNKSSTKSYNNKELLDHNNSSEVCYTSHLTKKNPMSNNFFDVSQFSSNHNSIAKNFENSFQFSVGGFLPNSGKHNTSSGNAAISANKQRPTSSHKSALIAAAVVSSNSSVKPIKKKGSALRKSVNANYSTNQSASYGSHL